MNTLMKMRMKLTCGTTMAGAALVLLAATGVPARAGDIAGGSALLDPGQHAQLERWLGAGEFNLNNVFTLNRGDTAADFHAEADAQGATFTLLEVTNAEGASYLVGGYNPQAWAADEGWHETPRDWQRTAFLFNMTDPAVYRQVPGTYILPSQGLRQTYNEIGYGPVFGSGPDLFVNKELSAAISWQLSYGNPINEGESIIDDSVRGALTRVDALEVFAIAPVPEPAPTAMLLAGMGVLAALSARRLRPTERQRASC
jgi:hypothetical protein